MMFCHLLTRETESGYLNKKKKKRLFGDVRIVYNGVDSRSQGSEWADQALSGTLSNKTS